MSHHGISSFEQENSEMLNKMFSEEAARLKLGPTDRFPDGKIADHDEGEIKIAITHYQGKVILNFGKPIAFIGFTPDQALEIVEAIISHSESARKQSTT